ncbi:MAG: zinc ribbon domain-containing protein [Nitrososphaerota archaeon]|nr:zinc ribbon domain-containing protein [Nitrososphaerota archaeon]
MEARALKLSLDEVSRWLVSPVFREEGPPSYIHSLISAKELAKSESTRQIAYLVLLGYRPATVSSIFASFVDNGNRSMYGAELGKTLESRHRLPEGSYTVGRYYDDRIGKILSLLKQFGVLEEETKHVTGTKKTTTAFRLSGQIYQLAKQKATSGLPPVLAELPAKSRIMRKCMNDGCIAQDSAARFCQYCGTPLSAICANCGKLVRQENMYCTSCGSKIA